MTLTDTEIPAEFRETIDRLLADPDLKAKLEAQAFKMAEEVVMNLTAETMFWTAALAGYFGRSGPRIARVED